MDEKVLREAVLSGFEYSYLHDEWVTSLEEALGGITAVQALHRPSEGAKGIWDIVLHLAVWHEDIVVRVMTGELSRPAEGAWPSPPQVADEDAWNSAKKQLWSSLEAEREMIRTVPWQKIDKSPYGLADLICRFTHNGYHIGQIVKMRELSGF